MMEVEIVKPTLDAVAAIVNGAPISGWTIDYEHDAETIGGRTAQIYLLNNDEANPQIMFSASRFLDNGELELQHGISVYFSVPGSNGDPIKEQTVRIDGLEHLMSSIEAKIQFREGVRSRINNARDGLSNCDLQALNLPKRLEGET